jgi:transposase-like protein
MGSEFKAEAVRLCRVAGRTVPSLAGELVLTETSLGSCVKQAKVDAGQGPPDAVTTAEREELQQLRRDNRRLQLERDILKKAAAFFAKEST